MSLIISTIIDRQWRQEDPRHVSYQNNILNSRMLKAPQLTAVQI